MKIVKGIIFSLIALAFIFLFYLNAEKNTYCLTGAFLGDKPSKRDIIDFESKYGKKPFLVMVFVDWQRYLPQEVIDDVYSSGSVLFVSWEPWHSVKQRGIDYDALLGGKWDAYIRNFAVKLRDIGRPVFLRFAHEMNGNWYPWAGIKIGKDRYVAIYRYVKGIFDDAQVNNVKWVFSVNAEDVPEENNSFLLYYPGDGYADYIGIDGYNWGDTKSWSRWMSFKEIFEKRLRQIAAHFKKPVIISEFSTTSSGGDKAEWIREAMNNIKKTRNIKAFVLFNADKETDWSFPADKESGRQLRLRLEEDYFKDNGGLN